MKYKKMKMICLLLAAAAVFVLMIYLNRPDRCQVWNETLEKGEKPVANPLKGFMAWGENYRKDPWISFAYVPVYWKLIEPEKGVYHFEELEQRCCFQQWAGDHLRLVLRVVADSPSGESHMDIPQWLYEEMGGAGDWYDCSYGKGFSPDYSNPAFQKAHRRLIQALAERYGDQPQVSFIQLGSLGHWGEWHINTAAGITPFPGQEITDLYVKDYLEVFPASVLLLRRPCILGAKEGMGLYNDSFGKVDSHRQWLSWIENGYVSDQNGEKLSGMPDFWKKAPSGGEFASTEPVEWYFSQQQLDTTINLMKESHTTFLGPNVPLYDTCSEPVRKAVEAFLQEMGYCLGVRACTVTRYLSDGRITAELVWENSGTAPLYQDWPIYLELRNEQRETVWSGTYESSFSSWIPGRYSFFCTLDGAERLERGTYRLYVGVVDPWQKTTAVALDMKGDAGNGLYEVITIKID